MTPRRLSVLIAFFPYAGNSTGSSMAFDVTEWFAKTLVKVKKDERIADIYIRSFCDTPITMTRNESVNAARELGADILVMVDSDMRPDMYPDAPKFWDVAFDKIYEHYEKGPLVIAAPYGGTPPHENMFVFKWRGYMNAGEETPFSLEQYTREEAAKMKGLEEAAALPTGLIMYDVRAFDLIEKPYFRYEWTDESESGKASTEDVQNTRDICIAGIQQLGYNPIMCAWDCWAGHLKVWCVGKPGILTSEAVSDSLKRALERGSRNERQVYFQSAIVHPSGRNQSFPLPSVRQEEAPDERILRQGQREGARVSDDLQGVPEDGGVQAAGADAEVSGGGHCLPRRHGLGPC